MVQTVTDANGATHFFEAANGRSRMEALVFVPAAVRMGRLPVESVPTVVYYHGLNNETGLRAYLPSKGTKRDPRPGLAQRRILFIMPWRGGQDQQTWWSTAAGLERLLDLGIGTAIDHDSTHPQCLAVTPLPPRIILAGHSGGVNDLRRAAGVSNRFSPRVTEAWALDGHYYGDGGGWISWCRTNPTRWLRSRTATASTRTSAQLHSIEGAHLPNADTEVVPLAHDEFPNRFLPQFSNEIHIP